MFVVVVWGFGVGGRGGGVGGGGLGWGRMGDYWREGVSWELYGAGEGVECVCRGWGRRGGGVGAKVENATNYYLSFRWRNVNNLNWISVNFFFTKAFEMESGEMLMPLDDDFNMVQTEISHL